MYGSVQVALDKAADKRCIQGQYVSIHIDRRLIRYSISSSCKPSNFKLQQHSRGSAIGFGEREPRSKSSLPDRSPGSCGNLVGGGVASRVVDRANGWHHGTRQSQELLTGRNQSANLDQLGNGFWDEFLEDRINCRTRGRRSSKVARRRSGRSGRSHTIQAESGRRDPTATLPESSRSGSTKAQNSPIQ